MLTAPNLFLQKKACKRVSLRAVCILESGEIFGLVDKGPVFRDMEEVLRVIFKRISKDQLPEWEKRNKERSLKYFYGSNISLMVNINHM